MLKERKKEIQPCFGFCRVYGCAKEGCRGGTVWREIGFWTVCSEHLAEYRAGKPPPKMKEKRSNTIA